MRGLRLWAVGFVAPLLSGCTATPDTGTPLGLGGTGLDAAGDTDVAESSGAVDSEGAAETAADPDDDGLVLDVGSGADTGSGSGPECEVPTRALSAPGPCVDTAPPGAFEPDVQWSFVGRPGYTDVHTIPLVANLTDDDGSGRVDLCDVPDVVVIAGPPRDPKDPVSPETGPGHIFILDGLTGEVHTEFDDNVLLSGTAALGDIDDDGVPEIIAVEPTWSCRLVAFEADGTMLWRATTPWEDCRAGAIALADLDADGEVEIIAGSQVFSATDGSQRFSDSYHVAYSASTAADLDGDGQLEAVFGHAAFRADGSEYYRLPEVQADNYFWSAIPQVANLDDDPDPEVIIGSDRGIWLLEHDGTVVWADYRPTLAPYDWSRPINIHDFDGDDAPEFGLSEPYHYGVWERDQSNLWLEAVEDVSGNAGGTAFDFLGAGKAQAIYADESTAWVFDDDGTVLMSTPRDSGTWIEFPVVADIDNDGSAEILVTGQEAGGFAVRAIRDVEDRWVPARRIWNQHAYHVTNVREDGTIPMVQPKSWEGLNTFRTQAQIAAGTICDPVPEG